MSNVSGPDSPVKRRGFLDWTGKLALGSALAGMTAPGSESADKTTGIAPGPQRARDSFGPSVWPPFDKVEAVLKHWSRRHPDRMRLEVAGRSLQGGGLYVIRLSDPKSDDADKEHALVAASDTDGSTTWVARGCLFVQINVPPSRLRTDDLFLVTCQYDPGETRGHWDSWRSGAEP